MIAKLAAFVRTNADSERIRAECKRPAFLQGGETLMKPDIIVGRESERGAALIVSLLMLALMLALAMGMSMTSISELGVTNTYANQAQAFQAAEAGLFHGVSLVRNFTNGAAGNPNFTNLLGKRGAVSTNYLAGNNPFTDSTLFAPGAVMITDDDANGHKLRDA